MRKTLPRTLCLILLALALAGCGHVTEGPKSTATFDPAVPRADTEEAIDAELADRFQRTKAASDKMFSEEDGALVLKHKFGKTVLPQAPQRIAVVGLEDTAFSMELPVVAAHVTKSSYLKEIAKTRRYTDISINAETKTVNVEEVQAVRPDLILLRDSYDKSTYDALSKIAPVAAFDLQREEVAALAAARAAGRPEEGERRLRAYYQKAKEARIAIKAKIGEAKVAFLRVLQKEIRLYPYSVNSTNRFMYELLNLRAPAMVIALDKTKNNMAISMESRPDLDADFLVISSGYGASSAGNQEAAAKRYEELRADPCGRPSPPCSRRTS